MHTLNICCQSNADRWRFIKTEVECCVKKAVHGEFTAEDIKKRIEEGRAFAAYAMDGDKVLIVCVWELVCYPRMTSVNIMCLGGSDARGMWDEFGGIMRKVWKAAGATHLESCVSPAMARLLQKTNYIAKPLYIHLRGAL